MNTHPKTRYEPTEIAPDTFLIHNHQGEGEGPVSVALNTMVIRAQEPVVVDTGMAEHRDEFLADVFSLVEPAEIRWVFISHDDVDHTGNVNALMDLAPNATLVVNWFMTERMGRSLNVPPTRQRWVGDGESLDVGDRVLQAVRPPIFDSPTTRGLFDPTTGV
jgi:flavorubredoxin